MSQTLRVYDGQRLHLPLDELKYIEAVNNYSILHRRKGKQILSAKTLKLYQTELPSFVRIHKNCLVNPQYIDFKQLPHRKEPTLQLITGEVLTVSRRRLVILAEVFEQQEKNN